MRDLLICGRFVINYGDNEMEFGCTGVSILGHEWNALRGTKTVNDAQWHHVVGVYDGRQMYLYSDGELEISANARGNLGINDDPVFIGANSSRSGRESACPSGDLCQDPIRGQTKAVQYSCGAGHGGFRLEISLCSFENKPIRDWKRWGLGMSDVTSILNAIERGDARAMGRLLPLVYEELRLLPPGSDPMSRRVRRSRRPPWSMKHTSA